MRKPVPFAGLVLFSLVLLSPCAATQDDKDKVSWFNGTFGDALASARDSSKRLLAYFWEDNDDCKALYGNTMQNDACAKRLADFVCLSIKKGEGEAADLIERFHVAHIPAVLVFDSEGKPDDAIHGYQGPEVFAKHLERIGKNEGTVSAWRGKVEADPADLDAQFRLAEALRRVGDERGYEGVVAAIRAKDKRGKTAVGARVYLSDLLHKVRQKTPPDTKAVASFLKRTSHKDVRWEGWYAIGWLQFDLQELDAARKSLQNAWKYCPADAVMDYSQRLATAYWSVRDKLKTADKKFLMKVGEAQAATAAKFKNPKAKGRPAGIENFDSFLATRVDVLACCYYMGGKRKPALAAVERCLKLDPKNEVYQKRLTAFKEGK